MKELHDYLTTMITPPEGEVLLVDDAEAVDWSDMEDASLHGVILSAKAASAWEGELPAEVYRVLKPGAHVMLTAADDDPTGFRGTCAFEDAGFQVRDTIAVMDTPGEFHYVAKASRAERNAGVSPREVDVGGQKRVVQNNHPTCKPVGMMQALLGESSNGQLVLDPFMGSGTTGVAAVLTNVNFIGIDMEIDHVMIAHQRVRHADSSFNSWSCAAEIESDYREASEEPPVGISDFFGI